MRNATLSLRKVSVLGTIGSVTFVVVSARLAGALLLAAGEDEVAEPEAEPDAEEEPEERVEMQYWPLSPFEQTAAWKGASM